jgi:hypothetical protein
MAQTPGNVIFCRRIAICSAAVFGANGTSFHRTLRAPLSHLGSFRTYRGRTIADINGNPQSNFPPIRLGVLAGRRWPPKLRPAHLFQICGINMAASGAEHDADRRGFPSNPSRPDARG